MSLIDLLIGIALGSIGAVVTLVAAEVILGHVLAQMLPADGVKITEEIAAMVAGACCCLAFAAPVYRRLHFFPMLFPRCPLCKKRPDHLHHSGEWPRLRCGCSECHGEFVIWLNGRPSDKETWDAPVLALKWPYVFGRYQRVEKPETVE
jgi:hypothetical protein